MTTRDIQREETKKRIYDVAFKLFDEFGYDKVKVSDIAKAANVSVGSVYYHYKNKEAIIDYGYYEFDQMLKEAYAKAVTYIRENMDILDEAAEFLIQRETITGKEFMEIFNKYKNPVEESDKNVSETDENDAEISEAEVKTDSEIKTEEENTSTYNTGYAQWVEDDDDEE